MNSVEQILSIFDDLDAYEASELLDALEERGYKVVFDKDARVTVEESANKMWGIFLKDYDESYKIMAIKTVRDMFSSYRRLLEGGLEDMGLRDTKEFVDNSKRWPDTAIVWGSRTNINTVLSLLENDSDNRIHFEIRII